jgi:hypothetical protein
MSHFDSIEAKVGAEQVAAFWVCGESILLGLCRIRMCSLAMGSGLRCRSPLFFLPISTDRGPMFIVLNSFFSSTHSG